MVFLVLFANPTCQGTSASNTFPQEGVLAMVFENGGAMLAKIFAVVTMQTMVMFTFAIVGWSMGLIKMLKSTINIPI